MTPKWWIIVATFAVMTTGSSASIFGDLLSWDIVGSLTGQTEGKNVPGREDEHPEGCRCEGMDCNCCVDFNLTSIIDLGGPGCVQLRYLSQDEGVALNVSYGDSLLHSKTVKKNDKKGSCMDLLSEFAQICAKFKSLKPTDDGGLEGCLHFEPHVLGEVTARYDIACFKMNSDGMVQDPDHEKKDTSNEETTSTTEGSASEDSEGDDDEEEETPSFLEVVNQGAEQGIAFFTDLLGLKSPSKKKKTTTEKSEEPTEAPESEDSAEGESSQEDDGSRKMGRSKYGRWYSANEVRHN